MRELPDEVVVYDRDRHQAHCLNRTAAVVFRNADGQRTVSELAALLGAEHPEGVREAIVVLALERLSERHLMEGEPFASACGLSRRDVMRHLGLGAAVLLPIVASVLAPTPAEAAATCVQSCQGKPVGTPCTCFGLQNCIAACNCSASGCCSDGGGC